MTFSNYFIENFQIVPGDQIFKLWAKNKIDFLQENSEINKEEIIKLSKGFGIPSNLTSFICVKQNENPVFQDMKTIKIPIRSKNISLKPEITRKSFNGNRTRGPALCSSNSGIDRSAVFKPKRRLMKMAPKFVSPESYSPSTVKESKSSTKIVCYEKKNCIVKNSQKVNIECQEREECDDRGSSRVSKGNSSIYMEIISAQLSEGYWNYADIKNLLKKVENIPKNLVKSNEDDVISTLYVLCYLYSNELNNYDEWVLVEKKAKKWLKTKNIDFSEVKDLVSKYL